MTEKVLTVLLAFFMWTDFHLKSIALMNFKFPFYASFWKFMASNFQACYFFWKARSIPVTFMCPS